MIPDANYNGRTISFTSEPFVVKAGSSMACLATNEGVHFCDWSPKTCRACADFCRPPQVKTLTRFSRWLLQSIPLSLMRELQLLKCQNGVSEL